MKNYYIHIKYFFGKDRLLFSMAKEKFNVSCSKLKGTKCSVETWHAASLILFAPRSRLLRKIDNSI